MFLHIAWRNGENIVAGVYKMDNLPKYISTWVVNRTRERHYLCRLCAGPSHDHGTEESFQRHLSSWGHRIRVREMEAMYCNVCSLQFNYPSKFKSHLKTKAHCHKVNPQPKPIIEYACVSCNVKFESRKDEIRHLATRKHAKNVAKTDSSPPLQTEVPQQ